MFSIGAHFLVAVLFDVAVAAGKVTSTKAVVFSPASNIAKSESRRSAPPWKPLVFAKSNVGSEGGSKFVDE